MIGHHTSTDCSYKTLRVNALVMFSPSTHTSHTCTTQTHACQTCTDQNTKDLSVTYCTPQTSSVIDRVYEDGSELDSPLHRTDAISNADVANELHSDHSEYEHEENCSCFNDSDEHEENCSNFNDSDYHSESDDFEHVSDTHCDYTHVLGLRTDRNVMGTGSARGVVFLDSDEE